MERWIHGLLHRLHTDGSITIEGAKARVFWSKTNYSRSFGEYTTVFQAELNICDRRVREIQSGQGLSWPEDSHRIGQPDDAH